MQEQWKKILAAALAVVAAIGGVSIIITSEDGGDGQPGRTTITIHVDGQDADAKRDDPVVVQKDQLEKADSAPELVAPLRGPDQQKAGVLEGPLAAQEFPGCRTRFVGNFSSRAGRKVSIIVWHQTVSRENGWASQDALTALANRLSSGVSWHLLIGRSGGRCTYTVPLSSKAWTQANANPFAVGIEVEAFGDESTYVTGAGKAKLLAATREIGRREGIPMRRGKVVNCQPVRSGIVEHRDLGVCGGGHVDVTIPGVNSLIAELAKGGGGSTRAKLLAGERRNVSCLQLQRRIAKRHGGWGKVDSSHLKKAIKCKDGLRRSVRWYKAHPKPAAAARASRRRQLEAVIRG